MPRPLFTLGKELLPIVQEAGWAPGPVWTGAENLMLRLVVTNISSWTVSPSKMGPIGCPETLVTNYQSAQHNIPEERGYEDCIFFITSQNLIAL
jgi:hypothetical protein